MAAEVEVPSGWKGGAPLRVEVCCGSLALAVEAGSDSEGFSSLVKVWSGEWRAGSDLLPWLYCPWCGAVLKKPPADPRPKGGA